MSSRRGATFIDLVIAMGIMVMLFAGIYMVYFALVDSVSGIEAKNAAASLLSQQMEKIRSLSYDQVGVQGGFPPGILPGLQNIAIAEYAFVLRTTVRNIDDPFDGTLSGSPPDTAPADYKLVELTIECPGCARFTPTSLTTIVAPPNLEASSVSGGLTVHVLDASGLPISGALVRVINNSTTPTMELIDTTGIDGILRLIGLPPSTLSYQIQVSKDGYSLERTHLPGLPANPNPLFPHATIATSSITTASFAIDKVSTLRILSSDPYCSAIPGGSWQIAGNKKIGVSPDVLKFATSVVGNAQGEMNLANLEWDAYYATATISGWSLLSSSPRLPIVVSPDSLVQARALFAPSSQRGLAVYAFDSETRQPIMGAVRIAAGSYVLERQPGEWEAFDDSWSGGAFSAQQNTDTESVPGSFAMALIDGVYSTSSVAWLESETMDFGTSVQLTRLEMSADAPPSAGPEALRFQVAISADGQNFEYLGPDGTPGSFYQGLSQSLNISAGRYARYRILLQTQDEAVSPTVSRVGLYFKSQCIPGDSAYFAGIPSGTYALEITAPGYSSFATSVAVASGWSVREYEMIAQ